MTTETRKPTDGVTYEDSKPDLCFRCWNGEVHTYAQHEAAVSTNGR